MSFSSPLIARLDTLYRQQTHLFIKSGGLTPSLRVRFHHDLTPVVMKHRGQWTDGFKWGGNKRSDRVPGIKRRPMAETPGAALLWGGSRFHCVPAAPFAGADRSQGPSLYLRSWRVFPIVNSLGSLGGIPLWRNSALLLKDPAGQCDRAKDSENEPVHSLGGVERHKETRDKETSWHLVFVQRAVFPAPEHNTQMFSLCIDYAGPLKSKK